MYARTGGVVAVLVAGLVTALALSGCAGPMTDAPGASASSEPTAPVESTPPSTPEGGDAASESPAAAAPAAPGAYVDYTDGAVETTAGTKALFFHASWCPQCRALEDDLNAEGVPDGLTVFKVDYDSRTDLRQRYGVTLQTTIVFVDDAGEKISSAVLYDEPSVASLVAAMPG
ncbi:thioredoxin family protein [Agromyces neolithicus]|uniref:Thioredoxin domain-containing protein n=1 Tax=Agromyces neolithicus TaxID=269420 RepID=A0ABP4Y1J8_9MICO